jgi:demethylmenaquinone methyltransferase/2-methoxy-6-polyprenyl-1,4-benzoquinol methylase
MQRYYADRAPEYDSIYAKPERQADLRLIERWLPEVFRGRRVLEIACGTGYWTQFIAPVATGVVAIDSARETIDIARGASRPARSTS